MSEQSERSEPDQRDDVNGDSVAPIVGMHDPTGGDMTVLALLLRGAIAVVVWFVGLVRSVWARLMRALRPSSSGPRR